MPADSKDHHLLIREGENLREGVEVRCANPSCGLGPGAGSSGYPLKHQARFLGVFFPRSRCYIKCGRCRVVNRIEIQSAKLYTIEMVGDYP